MVRARLGTACKGVSVEHGLTGAAPGTRPTFIVIGHLYFDTVEAFQTSFGPHATEIMQDVPKYTNLQPVIQISEVTIPLELAAAI
jgi:uncharacterized protein (TIGR02118 family)